MREDVNRRNDDARESAPGTNHFHGLRTGNSSNRPPRATAELSVLKASHVKQSEHHRGNFEYSADGVEVMGVVKPDSSKKGNQIATTAKAGPFQDVDFNGSERCHERGDFFEDNPDQIKLNSNDHQSIFEAARKYNIQSSRFFNIVTYLFGERKIVLSFMVHFVCTMVIWAHFGLIKFQEQEQKVPVGANRYWWKRMVPPLEFGSMHAILFQMALIPLTMSRLSIAMASSYSVLNQFIPFNRMVRFHIHLGYTMILIVFLATIFFFAFFGLLCTDGEQQFCDKFTVEIMITGYCILGTLLIIGITSFLRDRIPYEIFYGIHHLVFIMYGITTAHTFDNVQRDDERERSQTFKWYSATLLYYFCDRAAMYINHRYITTIAASSAVTSSKGTRMAIVKLHRPTLFKFKPGQYAYIRISQIDMHWHPFSIASGPDSDYLEFYMEVYGEGSWTNKVWNLIAINKGPTGSSNNRRGDLLRTSNRTIKVEVKGPYGTSLGNTEEYSHSIVIGSGTGVVPILSIFKQHIRQLLRLDPNLYLNEKKLRNDKVNKLYESRRQGGGSIYSWLLAQRRRRMRIVSSNAVRTTLGESTVVASLHGRKGSLSDSIVHLDTIEDETDRLTSLQDIQYESKNARRSIYRGILQLFLPLLGVCMLGFTMSWNTIPIDLYRGMDTVLQVGTIVFQCLFAITVFTVHDRNDFLTYLDVVMTIISFLSDWYWFERDLWTNFSGGDIVYYTLLTLYMTLRSWSVSVHSSCKKYWRKEASSDGFIVMDKMQFIWVTRSAHLVSEILPDIVDIWDTLVKAWGPNLAREVCDISIYVTDKDQSTCDALKAEMFNTSLYHTLHFQRPNLEEIIENHTLERINDSGVIHSSTLLAFCGSPNLSRYINKVKINMDVTKFITQNKLHQMDYVSESYGTTKSSSRHASVYYTNVGNEWRSEEDDGGEDGGGGEDDDCQSLATRSSYLYSDYDDDDDRRSLISGASSLKEMW